MTWKIMTSCGSTPKSPTLRNAETSGRAKKILYILENELPLDKVLNIFLALHPMRTDVIEFFKDICILGKTKKEIRYSP